MADGDQKYNPKREVLPQASPDMSNDSEKRQADAREARAQIARETAREARESESREAKNKRAGVAIEVTGKKSADTVEKASEKAKLDLAALEMEQFRDQVNSPDFQKINLQEAAEKQEPLLSSLAGTTIFELIPYLLQEKKVPVESLKNFEFFQRPPFEKSEDYFKTGNAEGDRDLRDSFHQIQQILEAPDTHASTSAIHSQSVQALWLENWGQMVESGQAAAAMMSHVRQHPEVLQSGDLPISPSISPYPKVPSSTPTSDKTDRPERQKSFWEEHSTALTVGAVGLGLAAGAYLLAPNISSLFGGKSAEAAAKESESSNFLERFFKLIGSLGLAYGVGYGLAKLSDTEAVRKWLKTFHLDDSKLLEALRLAFLQHDLEKAVALFTEGSASEKRYETVAAQINRVIQEGHVKPQTLDKIHDVPYRDLFPETIIDTLAKGAKDIAGAGLRKLPLIESFLKDDPGFEQELLAIEKFLALPENQQKLKRIAPGPHMTVGELLERLCDIAPVRSAEAAEALAVNKVAPAGKVGLEVKRQSEILQTTLQGHGVAILHALDEHKNLDAKHHELLQADVDTCFQVLDDVQNSSKSWWTREKQLAEEFIANLFGGTPEKASTEQDYIGLLDELQGTDMAVLQDLRTQVAEVKILAQGLKNGATVSSSKVETIKGEIATFYHNYGQLQAKLDEFKQVRIKEQEERAALIKSGSAKASLEKVKSGFELALNTFFGMPVSVVFLREDNGTVVTMLGATSMITAGFGFAKGLLGKNGGLVSAASGAMKGAVDPLLFVGKKGFALSHATWEHLDYWSKSAALRDVQQGRLTIAEGAKKIEDYMALYGREWRNGSFEKFRADPGIIQRMKSFGRSVRQSSGQGHEFLNNERLTDLEKQFKDLKKLEQQGCKTWQEAVQAGAVEVKNIELAEKLLKEMPIKVAEKSMEEAAKTITESLDSARFDTLASTPEKIEALAKAHKEADFYLEKAIEKAAAMRKAGVAPSEIEDFMKASQDELKTLRDVFGKALTHVENLAKTPEEMAAFEKLLAKELTQGKAIRGILKPVSSKLAKSMKFKGKMAFVLGTANLVYGFYKANKEHQEAYTMDELVAIGKEIGLDTLQMVVDIMSPYGSADWYALIAGKELITQKEIHGTDRAKKLLYGTFSLASDLLATIAGAATAEVGGAAGAGIYLEANAVETGLRAAGKSSTIIKAVEKLLPRLSLLAKESGGFTNLLKIMKSEKFLKALRGIEITTGAAMIGSTVYEGYQVFFNTQGQPEHAINLDEQTGAQIMEQQKDIIPHDAENEDSDTQFAFKNKAAHPSPPPAPQEHEVDDRLEGQVR